MIRLLRASARNDGTADGSWAVGDPFYVEHVDQAHELIDSGRAVLPAGAYLPPRSPAPTIERAAFDGGATPERSDSAPQLRARAPARDGGA